MHASWLAGRQTWAHLDVAVLSSIAGEVLSASLELLLAELQLSLDGSCLSQLLLICLKHHNWTLLSAARQWEDE